MDIFYNKAPSTLLKTCNSLDRLCNGLSKASLTFPCPEDFLYDFLHSERVAGAPPSRMKGILEAIVFATHTLGISKLDECINSRRCMGVSTGSGMHIIKQGSPLTVKHL